MPLPEPDERGSKETRGQVLVVGGSASVPGAVLLAGVAALRAGAGKLQLASVTSVAAALGVAVPEALVVALPETRRGEIAASRSHRQLRQFVERCDALLVGSGMDASRLAGTLLRPLIASLKPDATLILDAGGIPAARQLPSLATKLEGRVVLTPHAGEMASLLRVDVKEINDAPAEAALEAAARFGCVVALKGPDSWIATPAGELHCYTGGRIGLATSGSGDTLAGVVAGLAARGASPLTAALWGVYLHGTAGRALARRLNTVGFLARELLDEVPRVMRSAR